MIALSLAPADLAKVAAKLPAAPRLLVELGQLIAHPHTEAEEIVGLLRQDPALVAQIIRMANSAAYAPASPVGSIERALACVGFAEVHRLVGVIAARQLADQVVRYHAVDGPTLRRNALYVAVIMEELARAARESPRSCYTVGLLRTIGISALESVAGADAGIPAFDETGAEKLDVWERRHWGAAHPEVGEQVLREWKLPRETVAAVRHQYEAAGRHNPILHLLVLAAGSAQDRFFGLAGEKDYFTPTPENFTKAGIKPLHFQQACEEAQRTFDRLLMAAG